MEIKSYDHVRKVFFEQNDKINRQITHIEIKQQQLQNYIITLEASNAQLDRMIKQEQDGQKKAKYYHAQRSNLEMLNDLFLTYARYEEIKSKYHRDVSDLVFKEQHLLEVQIRALDDKSERYTSSDIVNTLDSLINGFKINQSVNTEAIELENDLEYKL